MGFAEWWQGLQRRLSRHSPQLTLGHRNLYIFLSRFGALWLLTAAVLYLLGTQAKSNTPVLLAFLMLSLLGLSLFLTHLNLQGLELEVQPQQACCAGEQHPYWIQVRSKTWRPGLRWQWLSPGAEAKQLHHIQPGSQRISLPWCAQRRGVHRPGRLLLCTSAPLGLFRCWTYWEPPERLWVAPHRRPGPVLEQYITDAPDGDLLDTLQPWRPEQGWQRVDWKAQARGRGWLSKSFTAADQNALWLAPAARCPLEDALEHLCDRLWHELQQGRPTGLVFPDGTALTPDTGNAHWQRCLIALAEWPPCPSA